MPNKTEERIDKIREIIRKLDFYYPQNYANDFGGRLYESDLGFRQHRIPDTNAGPLTWVKGGCKSCGCSCMQKTKSGSVEVQSATKRSRGGGTSSANNAPKGFSSLFTMDDKGVLQVKGKKKRKPRSDKNKPHKRSDWQLLIDAVYKKYKPSGLTYKQALQTASALRKKGLTHQDVANM